MSKVDRNDPKRSLASESTYSLIEFVREFGDDAACLDFLWRERYAPDGSHAHCPKCDRERKFHRVSSRPSYSCDTCGKHLHPTAGTIYHRSATSLHLWFYASYLMTSTRCGISAKQLERELGVGYKTAWRMATLIRNQLMPQDDERPLSGHVEADETWIGGKPTAGETARAAKLRRFPTDRRSYAIKPKTSVFAAVERGGRVRATVVPDSSAATLGMYVREYVLPEARLITDEFRSYDMVGREYVAHDRINHGQRVYVSGDVHTNTVEGFFGNLKRGISGNYHSVSPKWLQGYLNEFVWRYNHRRDDRAMFLTLISRSAVAVDG
ncbi:MAG TPA: IS1595 family transposase [Baekduia sp.]|nr:IS1595 family transposase [Baekduia sp.]